MLCWLGGLGRGTEGVERVSFVGLLILRRGYGSWSSSQPPSRTKNRGLNGGRGDGEGQMMHWGCALIAMRQLSTPYILADPSHGLLVERRQPSCQRRLLRVEQLTCNRSAVMHACRTTYKSHADADATRRAGRGPCTPSVNAQTSSLPPLSALVLYPHVTHPLISSDNAETPVSPRRSRRITPCNRIIC